MTRKIFRKLKKMILSDDNEMSELGISSFLASIGHTEELDPLKRVMLYLKFTELSEKEILKEINSYESESRKDKKHDK